MEDSSSNDYSEYVEPILSDRSIWADRIRFYKEYKELGARLHLAGYSNKYISDVLNELYKRWVPMYNAYEDKYGLIYKPDDDKEFSEFTI